MASETRRKALSLLGSILYHYDQADAMIKTIAEVYDQHHPEISNPLKQISELNNMAVSVVEKIKGVI